MLSIFAGSVTKILKKTNNKSYRNFSVLGADGGGGRLIESDGAYFIFPKSWPDMIIFLNTYLRVNNNLSCLLTKKADPKV